MDPHSGKLYPSLEDAVAAGVKQPVLIQGNRKHVQQISAAVQRDHILKHALLQQLEAHVKHEKYLKKKKKKKAAKHSRKKNR